MRTELKHGDILTPETHPDHETIGRYFRAPDSNVYYCDSYEHDMGFWMTQVLDPTIRRNVSDRAIGRTYHRAKEHFNFTPTFAASRWTGDIATIASTYDMRGMLAMIINVDGKFYRILRVIAPEHWATGDEIDFHLKAWVN